MSKESLLLRPTFVKINLARLSGNIKWLQGLGVPFLCPMIKANAYGHGDVQVAQKLQSLNCAPLGVGLVEEGMNLRKSGISCPIFIFGFTGEEAVKELLNAHLTPVISDFEQLELLVKNVKSPTEFHLKFNTGMNRLGFTLERMDSLLALLKKIQICSLKVCAHICCKEKISVMMPVGQKSSWRTFLKF